MLKKNLTLFLIVVLFFQVVSFGNIPIINAQYYSQEELEKEQIQLEKQRKIFEENLQNMQSQIDELSSVLNNLKNSNISKDKIKDIEEQLEKFDHDKLKLEKSESDLLERETIFKENWNRLQTTSNLNEDGNEHTAIPPWFKNNAKWWKQGIISDAEIINALESLIIQDVIPLNNFIKNSPEIEHTVGVQNGGGFVIPNYQKDVFGFWSDGLVSDTEIVNSIGHLMSLGIINSEKIQTEINQKIEKSIVNSAGSPEAKNNVVKYSDGQITKTLPDGTTITTFPDGRILEEGYDGPNVKMIEETLPDGTTIITFPDGNAAQGYSAGASLTQHPDGTLITTYPNGDKISGYPAGTITTEISGIIVDVYYPDNSPEAKNNVVKYSDGQITKTLPDGTTITTFPDGHSLTEVPKGKFVEKYEFFPDGKKIRVFEDGVKITTFPDGRILEEGYDGPNVKMIEETFPDGTTITTFPDGNAAQGYSAGMSITKHPDGKQTFTYPNGDKGFGYPAGTRVTYLNGKIIDIALPNDSPKKQTDVIAIEKSTETRVLDEQAGSYLVLGNWRIMQNNQPFQSTYPVQLFVDTGSQKFIAYALYPDEQGYVHSNSVFYRDYYSSFTFYLEYSVMENSKLVDKRISGSEIIVIVP